MNQIYFTGYDAVHPDDFIFDVSEGYDCYLLLITSTPAGFWIDGQIEEYPSHHAILYPPHHKIWYGASGEPYGNDWLRFASDESYVRLFPLMARPFPVSDPAYCHSLIQLLTWETSPWTAALCTEHQAEEIMGIPSNTADNKRNRFAPAEDSQTVSQLLRILFLKLREDVLHHAASPHDHELLMLRRQIINDPQLPWNVGEMAKQLHISTGHLQLLYKQKFGISCMDDVIECRLRKARDLLIYTDQSIAETAASCGYQNTEHFCRQFRKYVGITPGSFRKKR